MQISFILFMLNLINHMVTTFCGTYVYIVSDKLLRIMDIVEILRVNPKRRFTKSDTKIEF